MKLHRPISFSFGLLATVCSYSQHAVIDSLQNVLKATGQDMQRLNTLAELSRQYDHTDEYEQAIRFANEGLRVSARIKEKADSMQVSIKMAELYTTLGNAYIGQGNYPEALKDNLKALSIRDRLGKPADLAISYNNLGVIHKAMNNLHEALKSHQAALKFRQEANDKKGIADSYNNLGVIYDDLDDNPKAIESCLMALKMYKELGMKRGIAYAYNNLGELYNKMGNLSEAKKSYLESLNIKKTIGYKLGMAISYINLGELDIKMKNLPEAEEYLNKSLGICREAGYRDGVKEIFFGLAKLDSAKGNFRQALEDHKLYLLYKDSISNAEISSKVARMQFQYQAEKDEKIRRLEEEKKDAIVKAEQERQVQQNKRQQIIIWFSAVGLVLALTLIFYVLRSLKLKRKANDLLTQWNVQITRQKKEITDSINYAKRIQNSILPPEWMVKKYLPDSFVLYKAKDIVSGDFYWVEKTKENGSDIVLFAAVDCTGHGVPGAMMSVLGFNLISQAVEKGLTKPADILQHLDYGVNLMLRQSTEADAVKDGMDLALCSVNFSTNELQYAGVKNNLWMVKSATGELVEVRADKSPIGVNTDGVVDTYTNHTVRLDKGDCIYIFSDGYADQFGGPNGKKFKYRPMKELITSIHKKPMPEQRSILDSSIEGWKGSLEQIDDILVMGMRVS